MQERPSSAIRIADAENVRRIAKRILSGFRRQQKAEPAAAAGVNLLDDREDELFAAFPGYSVVLRALHRGLAIPISGSLPSSRSVFE